MNGWITPSLAFFICPTTAQTICTEQLQTLLPRFVHFTAGVDAEKIADMLVAAGCVQVSQVGDQFTYRGK